MTPEQRAKAGRAAMYTRLATEDRREMTASARAAAMDRFEKQVDPDGKLDPVERAKRAGYAKKAWFTQLSKRGVAARKRKAA
jgi:hypothetical protein